MHRMFLKAVKAFFFFMTFEVDNLDAVTATLCKKNSQFKEHQSGGTPRFSGWMTRDLNFLLGL